LTFYCLFSVKVIIFIVVQLLQKFNDAGLDVIKTESLYNERWRKRLFGVSFKIELEVMKDEVTVLSFFFFS